MARRPRQQIAAGTSAMRRACAAGAFTSWWRTTSFTAVVALGAGLLFCPRQARADDAVIDPGPVVDVAGGAGQLVWTVPAPNGVRLRRLSAQGAATDLAVASIRGRDAGSPTAVGLDVGTTQRGRPMVVYDGCRRDGCWLYRLALRPDAHERRQSLPRAPEGCRYERPTVAQGRIFMVLVRGLPSKRCRPGIYEITRTRAVLRVPATGAGRYDIDRDRVAYVATSRTVGTELITRRIGSGSRTVVSSTDAQGSDVGVELEPFWDGQRLWTAARYLGTGDVSWEGHLVRYSFSRGRVCAQRDATTIDGTSSWAFFGGRAFYIKTIAFLGGAPAPLLERTEPPIRLGPQRCQRAKAPAPAASAVHATALLQRRRRHRRRA